MAPNSSTLPHQPRNRPSPPYKAMTMGGQPPGNRWWLWPSPQLLAPGQHPTHPVPSTGSCQHNKGKGSAVCGGSEVSKKGCSTYLMDANFCLCAKGWIICNTDFLLHSFFLFKVIFWNHWIPHLNPSEHIYRSYNCSFIVSLACKTH